MRAGVRPAGDHTSSLPGLFTRRRVLIACIVALTILAALVVSLVEDRRYTASAEVLLPASGGTRVLTEAFRARPEKRDVAERTARSLSGEVSPGRIERDIIVDGARASVVVRARDHDARVAARVATAFARRYALAQMDLSYHAIGRSTRLGAARDNLVRNPNFEQGTEGWVRVVSPNPVWGVTRRWAAMGRASLRVASAGPMTGAATPDGVRGIPVEAGTLYGFSAAVRVRRLDRARVAYMRVRWSSRTGRFVTYSPRLYMRRTGVSVLRYHRPQRSPRGAAFARIELIAEPARGRTFDADLDEVRLERAGAQDRDGTLAVGTARRAAAVLRGSPLVEPASVPGSPSFPRPLSAALIAALAGSFLALAAAALMRRSSRAR
jgi:hypothetical protein